MIIKNTLDLFKKNNFSYEDIIKKSKKDLEVNGFHVFKNVPLLVKNLKELNFQSDKLIREEGDLGGWEGKMQYYKKNKKFEEGADRLGALVQKNEVFRKLLLCPEILSCAYYVVGNKDIKICGFNLRNPQKKKGNQEIHIDGFSRNDENEPYAGVVAFLYLNDSYINNGAMRVIPGSHKRLGYPDDHIDIKKKNQEEIRIEVKAGSIVVANLNLWHAGATNIEGSSRKVIMINVKSRNYDQLLNYKKFLSDDVKASMDESQKYILAIRNQDFDQKVDSGGSANQARRDHFKKKNNQILV